MVLVLILNENNLNYHPKLVNDGLYLGVVFLFRWFNKFIL